MSQCSLVSSEEVMANPWKLDGTVTKTATKEGWIGQITKTHNATVDDEMQIPSKEKHNENFQLLQGAK